MRVRRGSNHIEMAPTRAEAASRRKREGEARQCETSRTARLKRVIGAAPTKTTDRCYKRDPRAHLRYGAVQLDMPIRVLVAV